VSYEQRIHRVVDHRVLNDVAAIGVPTTENLAAWVMRELHRPITDLGCKAACTPAVLVRVRVCESSSTWCEIARTPRSDC